MEVVLAHGANPRVLHKRCRSHFELPSCTERSGVCTGIINNNLKFHCRRIYALIPFEHPEDPGPSWWGDSVGKYEGDTLVIDTIGFNDKTWLDHLGRPHTDALHLTERWRRVDPQTLQLDLTFDDPKAYTRPFPGRRLFKLSHREFIDNSCSYSENQQMQKNMINGIVKPPSK